MQIFEKILNDYKKSVSIGFHWTNEQEIIEQIHSELEEVKIELQKEIKMPFKTNWGMYCMLGLHLLICVELTCKRQ